MQSIREAGCLTQSFIGCALLIALGFGCMIVSAMSFRAAMPEPQPPVEIVGTCPSDEAQVFVDGIDARLESVFTPLEQYLEGDHPLDESMQTVDMSVLIAARDAVAQTELPECAIPVLEAELALIDEGLDILGSLKDCVDASEGDGGLCVPKALFKASTRLPGLVERVTEGYRALTEAAGIEMPEDVEFGEGDGGLRIKMDEIERSDEFHIP